MSDRQKRRTSTPSAPAAAQPADSDTIDLLGLMYRLLSNWMLIVCMALVFAIAAGVYTFYFVTPMYQATSTIYVLSRRDSAINMSDLQIGTALTSDYIKVFKMWEVHEQVISNLDLPYSYPQMRSMLSVVNESDTRMLDISITSPSAEEAAAIANEYAKVASQYIADTMSTDKPNIMSVALVPSNPVSPNKTRNVMLGFLLGAVLAAGIVTLRFIMDDKYKTAEDIRMYTGLITLAVVPVEESDGSGRRNAKGGRRKA
ncbi:MAG: Wzz/FepE/Etk N-terminal domain-containing protein [Clostridia bacterium]|nr:Wzz/FepE/Etk N-terminal domain-containing protein [Clostridia bacterium]